MSCPQIHGGAVRWQPSSGVIAIRGSGADIWDRADECYFAGRRLYGDGQITVRALSRPTDTQPWAKAGVMIRATLSPGARHVSLLTSAENGLNCGWRSATDGTSESVQPLADSALNMPITLRLTRRGSTIRAEYSPNGGRTFHLAAPPVQFSPPLPPAVYAGLAITANDREQVSEAKFQDVEIRGQ